MEPITLLISETNIFHSIVDHVGPMLPLQRCQTELKSREMQDGQISILLHRMSYHAVRSEKETIKTMAATVERHSTPSNLWPRMRCQTRHAQSIEQEAEIMVLNVLL